MAAESSWSLRGVDPRARERARNAAKREGVTIGEWLNRQLLEDGEGDDDGGALSSAAREALASPEALADVLDRLSSRIEAAEHRSTLAITSIDQSILGVISRLQNAEELQDGLSDRYDAALDDLRATQDALHARIERMERDGGNAEDLAALKSLEDALAKVSSKVHASEAETKTALDGLKTDMERATKRSGDRVESVARELDTRLADVERKVESDFSNVTDLVAREVETTAKRLGRDVDALRRKVDKDVGALRDETARSRAEVDAMIGDRAEAGRVQINEIEGALASMNERLGQAERATDKAIKALERSFQELDAQVKQTDAHLEKLGEVAARDDFVKALESRFEDLSRELSDAVASTRADIANTLVDVARKDSLTTFETQLQELGRQVEASEAKQHTSLDRIAGEVAKLASAVEARVRASDEQTEARLSAFESALGTAQRSAKEAREAAAAANSAVAERNVSDDARFAEKLADVTDRIGQAEAKSAAAVAAVGRRVDAMDERSSDRGDSDDDLAQRIRESEERTRSMVEGALTEINRRLDHTDDHTAAALSPVQRAVDVLRARLARLEGGGPEPGADAETGSFDTTQPSGGDGFEFADITSPDAYAGVDTDLEIGVDDSAFDIGPDDIDFFDAADAGADEAAVAALIAGDQPKQPEQPARTDETNTSDDLDILAAPEDPAPEDHADIFADDADDPPSEPTDAFDAMLGADGVDDIALDDVAAEADESSDALDGHDDAPFDFVLGRSIDDDAAPADDAADGPDHATTAPRANAEAEHEPPPDFLRLARDAARPDVDDLDPEDAPGFGPATEASRRTKKGRGFLAAASGLAFLSVGAAGVIVLKDSARTLEGDDAAADPAASLLPPPASAALSGDVGDSPAFEERSIAAADPFAEPRVPVDLSDATAQDFSFYADGGALFEPIEPDTPVEPGTLDALLDNAVATANGLASSGAPAAPEAPEIAPADAPIAVTAVAIPPERPAENTRDAAPEPMEEATDVAAPASSPGPADASGDAMPVTQSVEEAAAQGDPVAQYELGVTRLDDGGLAEGVRLVRQAAENGLPAAQYRLGKLYETGRGVEMDVEEARRWTERAASAGHRNAMHNLGILYAEGRGAPQNFEEAARWFEEAALLGATDSQFNLAVLYEQGLGVPESPSDAYIWFSIAARAGDADATARASSLGDQLTSDVRARAGEAASRFSPRPLDDAANGIFTDTPWSGGAPDLAATIARAQTALTRLGYAPGPADGVMGQATAAAIEAYQNDNGLDPTGVVDARLLEKMEADASAL